MKRFFSVGNYTEVDSPDTGESETIFHPFKMGIWKCEWRVLEMFISVGQET